MPKDALTPQARHHFTRFDQVDQLAAREMNPDLGFMGCLPRRGSGDRGDLRERMAHEISELREGMAKLEGLLEGLREAITGRVKAS